MNENKYEVKLFKNRPNYHLRYHFNDGCGLKIDQDYWISRSIAVVGVVFVNKGDGLYVLITKRSNKMLNEASKYGVPCGYLDYNETTHEAMIREVYEETSLYLPDYEKQLIFDNNKQPICINDDPNSKHQNIALIYLSAYNFVDKINKFPLFVESFTSKETAMVKWMKMIIFYSTYGDYLWAFHHDDTIKDAMSFFNKNFERK
ncbi:MAG: NUDIX hydrolase [Candidatus Paceibacterota bacterium]